MAAWKYRAGGLALSLLLLSAAAGCSLSPGVAPKAEFVGTPTGGSSPLMVRFTDQSNPETNPITAWSWDFGDGSTSAAQNPSHAYSNAAGSPYKVTLTVTTAVGSNTRTRAGYITVAGGPVGPTAQFVGAPTTGAAPLTVQFTDQSSAGTNPITGWSWDFGDGSTSTAQSPSHVYNGTAGSPYTVTLTVTTSVGSNTRTRSNYISVGTSPVGPTAEFVGAPTSGAAPLTVQFTDQSSAGTSPITSWSWSFGDGATSTAQSPSHAYSTAGSPYTVTLTVTTSVGSNTRTRSNYISVGTAPVGPIAEFVGAPTGGTAPLTVQFTDQSSAGTSPITSWWWSFGDGSTSTAQSPSHVYNGTAGSPYTVSLKVTTADGTDTRTRTSYISVAAACPTLTCSASATPSSGTAPLTVQFSGSATGGCPAYTYAWDFGDGGTSAQQNPLHAYCSSGSYAAQLTLRDSQGHVTTCSAPVLVGSPPGNAVVLGANSTWQSFNYLPCASNVNPSGTVQSHCQSLADGTCTVSCKAGAGPVVTSHVEAWARNGEEFTVLGACDGTTNRSASVEMRYRYDGLLQRSPPLFGTACVTIRLVLTDLTTGSTTTQEVATPCESDALGTTAVSSGGVVTGTLGATLYAGHAYRAYAEVYGTVDTQTTAIASNFDLVDFENPGTSPRRALLVSSISVVF